MDPNALINDRFVGAVDDTDWEEAKAAIEDLEEWLRKGGFPPEPSLEAWETLLTGMKSALEYQIVEDM